MIIDKPVILTHHFRQNLKTYNIPSWKLLQLLPTAEPTEKPKGLNPKYPDTLKHCRNGTIIFSYDVKKDTSPSNLGLSYIMITVFDQKMYLGNKQLEEYPQLGKANE